MQGFAYFPAIVYRDERPDLVRLLKNFCVDALNQVRCLNSCLTQSESLVNDLRFKDVSNYILLSSVEILKQQGYNIDKYDFYVQSLWAQEIISGCTDVHVHKNSQISGWLFLEVPENSAYPVYYDSRKNKEMIELDANHANEITNATNIISFNNIVEGTVLLSNSWLGHQLISGQSKNPTRCLHFTVSHKERSCSMS